MRWGLPYISVVIFKSYIIAKFARRSNLNSVQIKFKPRHVVNAGYSS
jgi:hypothetical protein